MPRRNEPWRRGGPSGDWWSTVRGKQVRLAAGTATKTEAHRILVRMLASDRPAESPRRAESVGDVIRWYLADLEAKVADGSRTASTEGSYTTHLRSADAALGKLPVVGLTGDDVTAWINGVAAWKSSSTRNLAVSRLSACLAWAVKRRLIPANPIAGCDRPPSLARAHVLSPADADALEAVIPADDPFLELWTFLRETGARGCEARQLTAAHVDWAAGVAACPTKRTRRGGTVRAIVLSARAMEVCRRLAEVRESGPLFRTKVGSPWNRTRISERFRLYGGIAGVSATAHGLRHMMITDLLVSGVPAAVVAAIAGHASIAMIDKHYNRTRDRIETLKAAVDRVRPG